MLAIGTAGILLTGCGSSSPAPAVDATGPEAFSYDIAHRHFAGPVFAASKPANLLTLGQAMCTQLDKGRTIAQLNEGMLATKTLTATAEDDAKFVSTVVVTLCPRYVPQLTGPTTAAPTTGAR